MDRRSARAGIGAGIAVVLLTVAASSDQLRIWITPNEVGSTPRGRTDPAIVVPQTPTPSDQGALPSWIVALLPFVGVLLIVLVAIVVMFVRVARPFPKFGWLRMRLWKVQPVDPLPEVMERELAIDMEAARSALSSGNPRNAIVACWIQLERDAAEVGLSRMSAETAAEYVERVVAVSSIDTAPIRELAALYREARFSLHELSDHDQARALDALHRVEISLRGKQMVSA